MRRFLLLMVLFAGCAPTRPYTQEQAYRQELPPPREAELRKFEATPPPREVPPPPPREPPMKHLELQHNTLP
jgi:hypothetical protein